MTAFAHAMLDALAGNDGDFTQLAVGTPHRHVEHGHTFIQVAATERRMLTTRCAELQVQRILDVGCCVGRHLLYIRGLHPACRLVGIERDPTLLDHCRNTIPQPFEGFSDLADLPNNDQHQFDLVLLLGQNAGIFGTEQATRMGLIQIHAMIRPAGALLVQGGVNFFGQAGFTTQPLQIQYNGQMDPPFNWGFCQREWLTDALLNAGFANVVDPPTPGQYGVPIWEARK